MTRFSEVMTPQSVTNQPKERADLEASEVPDHAGNRAPMLLLILAISLAFAFTAGYVIGMKTTNDYFQEGISR